MLNGKPWWAPIAHFAAHAAVGAAIFVIIAIPALALGAAVHYLPSWIEVPPYTLLVLEGLEMAIVTIDALLFLAYLGKAAISNIKEGFR